MSSEASVEYVEVSIEEFGAGSNIPYDIYIKLGENHYVRIASQGDDLTPERLAKYKDRHVTSLYLTREDFLKYVGLKVGPEAPAPAPAPAAGEAVSPEERELAEMCKLGDLTLEIVFFNEMNEIIFGTARNFVDTTVALLTDNRQASQLLAPLNKQANFIYAHGVAVSAYAVMIAREMGWTNVGNIFKLATGALLHDIGKRDFDRDLLLKPKAKLKPEEKAKLEQHPVLGVKILEQVPSVPTDILEIVLQHHENALGTGYPNKLSRLRMHPMARIVATANGFCDLVLRGADGPGLKPKEAIASMEASKEYDPEPFGALKNLFSKA